MRYTGKGYVQVIDYIFFHESEIRKAVYEARHDIQRETLAAGGGSGSHISNPTESEALRNITPLSKVTVGKGASARELDNPELWLQVIDKTYEWCDHDQRIAAKDKYSGVDWRVTCAKLSIVQSTLSRLISDVRHRASLCAVQYGLIVVC